MKKNKLNFIVGLVVLIAFCILIFGIHFLRNTVPGEKRDEYHVVFDKVSTLAIGDPVKLNGVSMGRVRAIELWQNKVRVTFEIKRFFKGQNNEIQKVTIPRDSKIRVQNIGLMGERQIEIYLGESREIYKSGEIIQNGLFDAGIAETMGTAGKVFEEAEELVVAVRRIVDSTVGREEFIETFGGLLENGRSLTGKLRSLLDEVDPKIKSSVDNLEAAGLELENLIKTQRNSIDTIIQSGLDVSKRAEILVEKIGNITDAIAGLVDKMNSADGTMGALINDSLFYQDLKSTLNNADSLISLIKKEGLNVNVDIF